MRKYIGLALAIAALVIPASATAAYLHEQHQNSKCPTGLTGWHFVNNQLDGEDAAYLTVIFDTGTFYNLPGEKKGKDPNGTFHWTVFAPAGAVLLDAYTDTSSTGTDPGTQVAGKLVLSNCVKKG